MILRRAPRIMRRRDDRRFDGDLFINRTGSTNPAREPPSGDDRR